MVSQSKVENTLKVILNLTKSYFTTKSQVRVLALKCVKKIQPITGMISEHFRVLISYLKFRESLRKTSL